jgi:hypothetical protein
VGTRVGTRNGEGSITIAKVGREEEEEEGGCTFLDFRTKHAVPVDLGVPGWVGGVCGGWVRGGNVAQYLVHPTDEVLLQQRFNLVREELL